MDNFQKHAFLAALNDFARAAELLSSVWTSADFDDHVSDLLSTQYPFQMSFDELVIEIEQWKENVAANLFRPQDAAHEYTTIRGVQLRVIPDPKQEGSNLWIAPADQMETLKCADSRIAYYADEQQMKLPDEELLKIVDGHVDSAEDDGTDINE
jgi:hypothetical protein